MKAITIQEVADFYGVKYVAGQRRMRKIRIHFGKQTGEKNKKGGDPITWDEFREYVKTNTK